MTAYAEATPLNDACAHKAASHSHGTPACYVHDRCRCDPCRESTVAYNRRRRRWAGEFPYVPPPLVDATRARRRLRRLAAQGMGPKRVAQVSGVPHGAISKLLYGDYAGRKPSRRIRRETETKLLAVELDLADGAKVDGREAWAIVGELLARGWWKAEIGRHVHGPRAYNLQIGQDVFVSTLKTLRRLLTEPVPARINNRAKRPYQPHTDHVWRTVPPTTPGVASPNGHAGNGLLTCGICGDPITGHPIFSDCYRKARTWPSPG